MARPKSDPPNYTRETPVHKLGGKRYAKVLNAPAEAKKLAVPIGSVQANGGQQGKLTNKAGCD